MSITMMPNDTSFLVYQLDLVHELHKIVVTVHVDLKLRLEILLALAVCYIFFFFFFQC